MEVLTIDLSNKVKETIFTFCLLNLKTLTGLFVKLYPFIGPMNVVQQWVNGSTENVLYFELFHKDLFISLS